MSLNKCTANYPATYFTKQFTLLNLTDKPVCDVALVEANVDV